MKVIEWQKTFAAIWRSCQQALKTIQDIDLVDIDKLPGIEKQKKYLNKKLKIFLKEDLLTMFFFWERGAVEVEVLHNNFSIKT